MKPWKLRKLAEDVVWDLRNRGLLPVVALLVVALVVLPVMILSGAKEAPSSAPPTAAADFSAPEAETAVLAYNPGVRDYKKRLAELAAQDPFQQHYQSTSSAAALSSELGGSLSTGSGGAVSGTLGGGKPGGGGGGGDSKTIVKTKYLSYSLDAAVGEAGALKIMRDVDQLAFLPSESTPVLIFLGISDDGAKAMFLVSSDVSAASGEGSCMPSSSSPCEVLVLRPGQIENLTYDPDGKVYRIKVLAINKSTRTVSD
jgi:hypothetical protein